MPGEPQPAQQPSVVVARAALEPRVGQQPRGDFRIDAAPDARRARARRSARRDRAHLPAVLSKRCTTSRAVGCEPLALDAARDADEGACCAMSVADCGSSPSAGCGLRTAAARRARRGTRRRGRRSRRDRRAGADASSTFGEPARGAARRDRDSRRGSRGETPPRSALRIADCRSPREIRSIRIVIRDLQSEICNDVRRALDVRRHGAASRRSPTADPRSSSPCAAAADAARTAARTPARSARAPPAATSMRASRGCSGRRRTCSPIAVSVERRTDRTCAHCRLDEPEPLEQRHARRRALRRAARSNHSNVRGSPPHAMTSSTALDRSTR